MRNVEILDCTLRDGSYLINFQFNTNDTYHLSKLLESSGIKYIEVGHGLGLDAGKDKNFSLETDLDYVLAAKEATKTSKIGVFYIPGIGKMSSIEEAVKAGLDFIRVGVNVNEFNNARETIKYAKSLGLEVWLNLMKTYTVDLNEWKSICTQLKDFECNHLAIVDSAGGMLPSQVKEYCRVAKELTGFNIGFHGHNNLQLAVANCLAAVEGGATIVDGTLFGMGRSGGNASTEILASIFRREKFPSAKYEVEQLIEIANGLIAPLARKNLGDGAVELASGVNLFHSSFFKTVKNACDKSNASVFRTILNLPVESREFVTPEMVEATIAKIGSKKTDLCIDSLSRSNTLYLNSLDELSKYLKELGGKTNLKVAMSLSQTSLKADSPRISNVYALEESLVGHIEFSDEAQLGTIINHLKGLVNVWALDVNAETIKSSHFKDIHLVYYDETQIEKNVLINEVLNSKKQPYEVVTKGSGLHIAPSSLGNFQGGKDRLLVVGKQISEVSDSLLNLLSEGDSMILTHRCKIDQKAWDVFGKKKITVYRLNYTLALAYEVEKIVKYQTLILNSRGKTEKKGVEIVSGGVLAKEGSIIVDNFKDPSIVFGISDGHGGVRKLEKDAFSLQEIKENLFPDLR